MSVPEGGLMIDLSLLRNVRVDPEQRRAWVQGGALLGALDRASQAFGLATTAGNVSHTGVGGLTLGGGMGWLARQYGLACDNVVGYEVVTADGNLLWANESENADLYWGLRGGGGNFGIVTEFEFRLHPIGTAALMTDLYYRPDDAAAAMRVWRDLIPAAPRNATFTASVGTASASSWLPADMHGRSVVKVGYVWVGDPDRGRDQLAAVGAAVPPAAEHTCELTYLDLQTMDDQPEGHNRRRYWKGHYLRALDDAAIEAFISRGVEAGSTEDPRLLPSGGLQAYGGAIADVAADETAFSHRDVFVEFVASTGWTDPAEDDARMSRARQFGAVMEPFASGVYVNSLVDEGRRGVQQAYGPANLARLTALKEHYDPDNIFHLNHNIRPRERTAQYEYAIG